MALCIVLQKLDHLPWEMIDVFHEHPTSRMTSLHFTYALFKKYEDSIVDGAKADVDPINGKYILNPSGDLNLMEKRMRLFFEYWLPDWEGLVNVTPTHNQFEEMLTNCCIFS